MTFFASSRFLWAQLQIQQLRLRKIRLEDDLLPALETNILADLDQLYEETLQIVLNGGNTTHEIVVQIISWLLYMKSPLSPPILLAAVTVAGAASKTLQPSHISEICANLVYVDSQRGLVDFSHQSIREYLLRAKKHLFSPRASHSLLASTCIDVCSIGAHDGYDLAAEPCNLYFYASVYWAIHFGSAGPSSPETALFRKMLEFVVDEEGLEPSPAFEMWMDSIPDLATQLPNDHPMKPALEALPNKGSSPLFLAAVFGLDGLLKAIAELDADVDWNQRT